MCRSLADAGATIKWVYDPNANKTAAFARRGAPDRLRP